MAGVFITTLTTVWKVYLHFRKSRFVPCGLNPTHPNPIQPNPNLLTFSCSHGRKSLCTDSRMGVLARIRGCLHCRSSRHNPFQGRWDRTAVFQWAGPPEGGTGEGTWYVTVDAATAVDLRCRKSAVGTGGGVDSEHTFSHRKHHNLAQTIQRQ